MIVFDLRCEDSGDVFEAWFKSSADFEAQRKRALGQCPVCQSTRVAEAPMAPRVPAKSSVDASPLAKLAALQGETTWRVPVTSGPALGVPQPVRIAQDRTRTVVLAPDGRLWATTSSTDGRGTPRSGGDEIVAFTP